MNEIKKSLTENIRKRISTRLNKMDLEELFGLVIKKNQKKDGIVTYNIYDKNTKELLVPEVKPWDFEDIFKYAGFDVAEELKKNAELESDDKGIEAAAGDIDLKQQKFEKKYYKTCPICGFRYNSLCQSHGHY